MSEFGTGCLVDSRPDPLGKAGSALRRRKLLGGSLLRLDRTVDWRDTHKITRQTGNSCTGFARSAAVRTFLSIRGVPDATDPDPYRNYWFSRRKHGWQNQDSGSYIRSAIWAGRFGDVFDWEYPFEVNPVFDDPNAGLQALRAMDIEVKGARIFASGEELVRRIEDSIMRKQPVIVGLRIDEDFMDPNGPLVIDRPTKSTLGLGHAMNVLGGEPGPRGLPRFYLGNYYGSWRDRGTVVVTGDYIAEAFDCSFIRRMKWNGQVYHS